MSDIVLNSDLLLLFDKESQDFLEAVKFNFYCITNCKNVTYNDALFICALFLKFLKSLELTSINRTIDIEKLLWVYDKCSRFKGILCYIRHRYVDTSGITGIRKLVDICDLNLQDDCITVFLEIIDSVAVSYIIERVI